MKNRYPGTCYRCGGRVAVDEGLFEVYQWPGQRWPQLRTQRSAALVQHESCAIKFRGTDTHYLFKPEGQ